MTKDFDVPLKYAYEWCTDFREDDPSILGSPYPRHIVSRRGNVFVWIHHYLGDGKEKEAVRIVTLRPPDAWHNEALNDEKESSFDYKVKALGNKKSRLTITAKIRYKTIDPEDKDTLIRNLSADWDKYKAALEKDYASGKAARA